MLNYTWNQDKLATNDFIYVGHLSCSYLSSNKDRVVRPTNWQQKQQDCRTRAMALFDIPDGTEQYATKTC